jgi:hypothetical protein
MTTAAAEAAAEAAASNKQQQAAAAVATAMHAGYDSDNADQPAPLGYSL